LSSNIVAEKIDAQVHGQGRRYMLMDSIINHCKDESTVPNDDKYVVLEALIDVN
jgi:hypothetical protein